MNKKILLLTISILLLIFVAAYLIFKPTSPKNVQTELRSITDKQFLTEDTTRGALSIELSIEVPVAYTKSSILDKIKSEIYLQLVGEQYLTMPEDTILPSFVAALKAEYLNNNAFVADKISKTDFLVLNNSFYMEGFSLLNDEHIFTYGILRDVDFGGNHPTRTRFFFNYDLKTGEQISEDDIFIAGYEEELTALLRAEVQRISKENDEMPTIDSYENSIYTIEAIRPNGNFYINDEGICFVFNPYEIAPLSYAYEIEVMINYQQLKTLMKENNPLQYLVLQHETALSENNN
ncbi:MAG: RsiV family protein [Paludibacter sp.]|jgi:hypothetical protein|nr:RsiV family protein [Paludibacter sp.]